MTIGIIGAMQPEVESLIAALENHSSLKAGPATIHQGQIAGHDVAVVQCGIGKVAASAITALLIEKTGCSRVINTGCAGAINSDLRIGDLVFSSEAAHHDADLTVFGYKKGQMAGCDPRFKADAGLIELAGRAVTELEGFKGAVKHGLVVSGDQFINTPDAKNAILKDFPDAMVAEMEGASIAQVCSTFKVPFLIIRAVSDEASEGNSVNYDEFMPRAAALSAELVRNLIALI